MNDVFHEHEAKGDTYIDVKAGDLHRRVGGYPGPGNRMPTCCNVMNENRQHGDEILNKPLKGKGASLKIRYKLPRLQTLQNQRDTLIVISCTRNKIWDKDPSADAYVPAKSAYIGTTIKDWLDKYQPKLKGYPWVILSAKYGFIEPEHPLGNYDVTFSDPKTGPISDESLKRQVVNQKRNIGGKERTLKEFEHIIVLGSKDYANAVEKAFNKKPLDFNKFFDKICSPNLESSIKNVGRPLISSDDHRRDVVRALLDYRSKQETGGPFTRNKDADKFLRQNPFAFLMAASIDRGALAEAVWEIPFLLNKKLGHLDPHLLSQMSVDQLEEVLRSLERKPRFPKQSAQTMTSLSELVFEQFHGNATSIWQGREPLNVVQTLEQIWGVGSGIAHMVVRILKDEFAYNPSTEGWQRVDIKPDVQVRRLFYRTGIAPDRDEKTCVQVARELYPGFPGLLDWPAWEIGRTWCKEHNPQCTECPLYNVCSRIGI